LPPLLQHACTSKPGTGIPNAWVGYHSSFEYEQQKGVN
jgi:hypothetical protein